MKNFFQPYNFPNEIQQNSLIEIIVENFIEKCARKTVFYQDNKQKIAYELHDSEIKAFLHPTSFLSKTSPEFIIYTEIYFSKKLFD